MTERRNPDRAVRPSPRQNLYLYSNWEWLGSARIPDDRSRWSLFDELRQLTESRCRDIVAELPTEDSPSTDAAKVSALFRSFTNVEIVEGLGALPLSGFMERIDSIITIEDLFGFFGWSMRHGVRSLFRFDQDVDPGDPGRYVTYVGQGGIAMPDASFYTAAQHGDLLRRYGAFIAQMFSVCGVEGAGDQAQNVLALEHEIALLHWDRTRRRDLEEMYHAESWDDFMAKTGLPWEYLLEGGHLKTTAVERIINAQHTFPSDAACLLRKGNLDRWKSWARWMVVFSLGPFLSSTVSDAHFRFYQQDILGVRRRAPRWRLGLKFAEEIAGDVIGKMYVERYCPQALIDRALGLVDSLFRAFRDAIGAASWLEPTTRSAARRKLDLMTRLVVGPERVRDYSTLHVAPDDLVGNFVRGASFAWDYAFGQIGGSVDAQEWTMFPQTVNASYHPLRNRITIAAAMLQPPLFGEDVVEATEFGGIGALVAHEMSHAFDDRGSSTDWMGRVRGWWSERDEYRFKAFADAFVREYDGLSVECEDGSEVKVDGRMTPGENMADVGGLVISHRAWQMGRDTMPSLAEERAFFMGWASVWRAQTRAAALRHISAVDPHAPGEIRCNQTVKHVSAFHMAFGTRMSDEMWLDPESRISLW